MFPASFALRVFKLLVPHFLELLVPIKEEVKKHSQYVDEPNDADLRIDKCEEQIKLLAEDQHPPIFTEEIKEEIFNRLGKLEDFKQQVSRKKAFKRKED